MNVVDLTRTLLAFDTTNPPGAEAACARWAAGQLQALGLETEIVPLAHGRDNVIARWVGRDPDLASLVLTGHLDTVPLGAAPWTADPFGGEISEGRLFGRGASDMKGGLAAMIAAIAELRGAGAVLLRGVTLLLTAGEETGCAGALELVRTQGARLGPASAMVVGEPTANRIAIGHKGCLALRVRTAGVTAHSSMPAKGVNAIYRAARVVTQVEQMELAAAPDVLLGAPTWNVGMIGGGMNYNSVPDAASFTLDVRTTPAIDHAKVEAVLSQLLGEQASFERFVDMPPVLTDPDEPFVTLAFEVARAVLGDAADLRPLGIPFFSDASVFAPHLCCPTILLGPGEPDMAHQTDEYCRIDRLRNAVELYARLIARWCA